jgi:hypothetical protein
VGVLWARGRLRSVTPSDARLQQLERARALRRVVEARGYVSCAAAGPTMPSAGAPADPTARGFLQHVRENAFAFEDEPASDASRGNAGGPGYAFPHARGDGGRRLGRGADAGAGAPPPRPFAAEAGGRPSGSQGGGTSPGNPWGRQNVHLSTPPRADPDPGGGAGGREKTREPKPEAPKPELSREERAAAFASAAEKRRSQPERDERGGGSGGGAS